MENSNQRIKTLCFALFAAVCAFAIAVIFQSLAGAFGVVARSMDSDLVRHGLPVTIGLSIFLYLQFNKHIRDVWAEEVVVEVSKVVWPSQKDTRAMTIVVVIMVIISTIIISTFDFGSGAILNYLMGVKWG
jgi:preprotein translocase subunit SecE